MTQFSYLSKWLKNKTSKKPILREYMHIRKNYAFKISVCKNNAGKPQFINTIPTPRIIHITSNLSKLIQQFFAPHSL